MANEKIKKISRTIVTGYEYDVMKREGANLTKIGTVITDKAIRSVRQQKEILVLNKLGSDNVLVYVKTVSKQFEISESDFMKYATEVTEVTKNKEE